MGYVKVSGHKRCLLKTAMITGVTGQDGSYLAELLLDKGYKVVGLKRRTSTICTERLDHIFEHPNSKGFGNSIYVDADYVITGAYESQDNGSVCIYDKKLNKWKIK